MLDYLSSPQILCFSPLGCEDMFKSLHWITGMCFFVQMTSSGQTARMLCQLMPRTLSPDCWDRALWSVLEQVGGSGTEREPCPLEKSLLGPRLHSTVTFCGQRRGTNRFSCVTFYCSVFVFLGGWEGHAMGDFKWRNVTFSPLRTTFQHLH